jgi:hypothetical protein
MKTISLVWALCASLALSVWADTIVPAGMTLSVTNAEDLGFAPLQLGDASTLAFAGEGAAAGGLNEYTRTGAGGLGTPGITSYGVWTRITTNAFWADNTITSNATEYIYTGRWLIPADGTYSVFEHIDDAALIAIDGRTVLQNISYNTPSCVRDIPLTAGWHDLELRLFNGAASGGLFTNALASGFLFSPSNDLISVANQANAFPFADPGDGSVLKPVHNGGLFQKIFVDGETTFDLTAHGLDVPLALTASLLPAYTSAGAKVTLAGGTGELLFGTPNQGAQYTPYNADVAFTGVSDPAGVTFRDFSTLITVPTSCAWRVANNATVALYGTNLLGAGDVTLTNHNLYVLSPFAVSSDTTVHVQGTNLTAALKPCSLDSNGWWTGWAVTLTNDIALEGTGSTALFPINVDLVVQGTISGTGMVTKTGTARTEIKEPCTFVGPVSVSDTGTFIIDADTAGHSNNTVTVGTGSTFALYPSGYGASDTTAWIQTLRGSGKVYVPARQTLTVDYLDGALTVEGAGAALRVNTLGTNAVLSVTGQAAVSLGACAPGAALTLAGSATPLTVSGTGAALDSLILTSGSVPVSGDLTVNLLGGNGKLVKQGADALRVYFSTNSAGVQVDNGTLTLSPPDPETVLGALPALWLDASASNVFTQYKSYTYTNSSVVIERWNDCRPGAPVYGYNSRGEDYCQTYPYVLTNVLNGKPVVAFGSYQMPIYPPYVKPGDSSGTEARRLPLSTNIAVQYAVLVFGSQHGGGATVLSSDALRRPGSTPNDFRNPATPILASPNYPVWTNGVAVTATNTGFSGDYQIVSLNTKGSTLNALGWRVDNTTAGGQIYGEVLFYTNALTTLQRMTAEAYLAGTWKLPYPNTAIQSATVAAGATLEVGGSFAIGPVYGSGQLTVSTDTPFELSGLFTGTVTVDSGTLAIPDLPVPPDADSIPTDTLTGWFDPSLTNRVVFGGTYTPSRPLTVAALYDRTTTSRYLIGTCPLDMTFDRRPWLSATNGPMGETLHWLDYSNVYGDSNGNTLRLYRNPAYIGTATTGQHTPTNVQTGFIVLDSSRGGGVPITYDVSASSVFTRNNPQLVSSPIWGSASAGAVKNAQTFLDSVAVNGATRGYSGTTELLSFVTTNVVQAAFFGFYGGDGTSGNLNRERLGEIILFESALDDTTRAGIEAYLMKKWLGRARDGYSDATGASVDGSGTVSATTPDRLPAFAETFSGSVSLTADAFAFTVGTNALGQVTVTPPVTIPGALSVTAAGTLTVHFGVRPPAGTYTLLSYGSVAGQGFADWTLTTDGDKPAGPVLLKPTATALNILVAPQGTLIQML